MLTYIEIIRNIWYNLLRLVCDEAVDCCKNAGNYGRVCPTIGRRLRAFFKGVTRNARHGVQGSAVKSFHYFIFGGKPMAKKEKIRIRLKSYDHTLIDRAAEKIVEIAKRNGATVSGPIPLPTDKEIITILRAVHKYKDSREQFEYRTHKRLIDIIKPSKACVEALMNTDLPAGVDFNVEL